MRQRGSSGRRLRLSRIFFDGNFRSAKRLREIREERAEVSKR
jgi:hypothetical protein